VSRALSTRAAGVAATGPECGGAEYEEVAVGWVACPSAPLPKASPTGRGLEEAGGAM